MPKVKLGLKMLITFVT